MTVQVIVVEDPADCRVGETEFPVVHVDDYLTGREYFKQRNVQVINLCRSYRYLTVGYYCSLLAEARGHRVIPSVKAILDLSSKSMYSLDTENLGELVEKSFRKYHSEQSDSTFELDVFFGRCRYEALADLARQVFETFPVPLLRIRFQRQGKWHITEIKPVGLHRLKGELLEYFHTALSGYLRKRQRARKNRPPSRFDLAILYNPNDPLPPSCPKALQKFVKAGRNFDVDVDVIEKKDYSRLAEYDGLFIRDTTRIRHYTYRFAKKAESEGMVVIDDPQSILRCTNKVYLAELLRAHRVPTPRTVIVGKGDLKAAEKAIGFPMVLKVPDGSFSQGVTKAATAEEMREQAERLFKSSELILAQEFLYTEFDWRVGILNRRPIFASQYFMTKKHWQIVKYDAEGKATQGTFKTVAVEDAPEEVVATALRAANLIGDGLYGVDVKQGPQGAYVIEVNDNPNIDAGVEDAHLKGALYDLIMEEFVRRMEARRRK